MKKILLFAFLIFSSAIVDAQTKIMGTVTDGKEPLIGAAIIDLGSHEGTVTDFDGKFELMVEPGTRIISCGFVGYTTENKTIQVNEGQNLVVDFVLNPGVQLTDVVVLGSRGAARSNTKSPVPVDVIDMSKVSSALPQTSINDILSYSAPSFSSNTQTVADGSDHIDPASLRGLGPDQVLVLVNTKRRHSSSLVNVNGTFGRGSVGTDMNALPAIAISNLQVLRDGAAAQYGSDAIAGVINAQLKNTTKKLELALTTGANFAGEDNIGLINGEQKSIDGEKFQLAANYGIPLGDKGFINFSGEFTSRGFSNRMKEFTSGLFNGSNELERLSGYKNLQTLNLADLQGLVSGASFTADQKTALGAATDVASFGKLLNFDVTEAELKARGKTRGDFVQLFGNSKLREGKFFANMELPMGKDFKFYAFGGTSLRNGESGCNLRTPNSSSTLTYLDPNGRLPLINSVISDFSIATGIKGKVADWNVDFSNTNGYNQFRFNMDSWNATLGAASPNFFDAGALKFNQNTSNLDVSKLLEPNAGLKSINLAFGVEYRTEGYRVFEGDKASQATLDIYGTQINANTPSSDLQKNLVGSTRGGGCQCFSGFSPSNVVNAGRNSAAGYADVELEFSERFMMSLALRGESFSDFGSTINYKIASRLSVTDDLNFRAAHSTGFRAPSLAQIYFNKTQTLFRTINGISVAQETGFFANNSQAAKLLGIPQLKEESSKSYSIGFTYKPKSSSISLTADAYIIDIEDKVVLTGAFGKVNPEITAILDAAQANNAQFFANAIDTRSKGLDIVLSVPLEIGGINLKNDIAATFSETKAKRDSKGNIKINSSDVLNRAGLTSTYFDEQSRGYLEDAVPHVKATLSHSLKLGSVDVFLRNTYFGKTVEANNIFDAQTSYSGKIVTDLSLGVKLLENINLTIGANNLLNVYQDRTFIGKGKSNDGKDITIDNSAAGRYIYSRTSPQFGNNGRYLFARLNFVISEK